jgi:hypothetical protein
LIAAVYTLQYQAGKLPAVGYIITSCIRFPIESPDGARIMIGQEGAPAIDLNIVSSRARPTT